MFAGHYAAAFAAKAVEPKIPLWSVVAGCQLVDIAWGALLVADVEHMRVDVSLPGSALDLYDMPWTHSLPGALGWSLAAMLLAKPLLRLSWFASFIIGAVVFSHWILDLLVHRPDLALWPGGAKLGLGLWNYPVPEQALEIGLIAVAALFWGATRQRIGQILWPAAAFVAFLVAVQIGVMFFPVSDAPLQMGLSALALYLFITALALPVDRGGKVF
jgi:hypothetical protein